MKKSMKKTIAVLGAAVLAMGALGCGSSKPAETTAEAKTEAAAETQAETAAETEAAATEAAEAEATEAAEEAPAG